MLLIILLAFLGAFVAIALPLMAAQNGPAKNSKQVMSALDSALGGEGPAKQGRYLNLRKEAQLSSIPWLNRKLRKLELGAHLQTLLDQADVKWTVGRLLATCALCGLVPGYLVGLRYHHVLPELMVGILAGLAPVGWVLHKRTKRMDLFVLQLPEALDLMVSGLRAGHSLVSALGLVANECPAPLGSEFKTCFKEQSYGLELKTAFNNMIRRIPVQDLKIVTSAIMIQKESGGNLAELLDKASNTVRQRFRMRRQIKVHTAQGRMTGLILALLPVGLGLILYFLNPDMMSVLWSRPIGVKLLCASGGMTALGGLIIRHIVNIDV